MYNLAAFHPVTRLGLVVFLLGMVCVRAEAKRADTVVMKNGDRLTGEVKKLENGVLYVDTDYVSGSIGIDYLQVARIESTGRYQVVLNSGERFSGTIRKEPEIEGLNKGFKVATPEREMKVSSRDVANIDHRNGVSGASSKAPSISATTSPAETVRRHLALTEMQNTPPRDGRPVPR